MTGDRPLRRMFLVLLALATAAAGVAAWNARHPTVQAVSAADLSRFDPGNIISDGVFYFAGAMSQAEIGAFLTAKNPSCVPGSDGTPCLKDFRQDTISKPADAYCSGYAPAGQESAAAIIAKVAASCGVNPRVLLVMLQKEQGLVTASGSRLVGNPFYKAMGYGCPDTPTGCAAQYYGFQNQVYDAARQFKLYAARPTRYSYLSGQTNQIGYYPSGATTASFNYQNRDCGTQSVYIRNQATAGLYNYTPYVPNAAALNGSQDRCSSFGNRNFWTYFTDWFGTTQGNDYAGSVSYVKSLYTDVLGRVPVAAEVTSWADPVAAGMTPEQAARGFIGSPEQMHAWLDTVYQAALKRSPEAGVYAYWGNVLASGGSLNDLDAGLYGSPESLQALGGGDLGQWVDGAYRGLLGRPAAPSEQAFWAQVAAAQGTVAVAMLLSASPEGRAMRVNSYYQRYLQRPADPGGVQTWSPLLLAGGGDVNVQVAIASGPEYWARATARFPS